MLDIREFRKGQAVELADLFEAVDPDFAATQSRSIESQEAFLDEGAQALYAKLGGDRKPLGDVNYWWQLDQ